jgi:NNP family nitrate/nitrite transporter-like MFS transporter
MRPAVKPWRDAAAVTLAVLAAVVLGSRGGRDLDPALFGYAAATIVAIVGVAWRASAFWRRPASAHYGRMLLAAFRDPARLRTAGRSAALDLGAQTFIARRSRVRWLAHMALSLGTLASFAITVPLVFGWLHFEPVGQAHYQPVLFGFPAAPALSLDGIPLWFAFHGLTLAGVAVAFGSTYFLAVRLRTRTLPGVVAGRHVAPLLLLLLVALSGLALPASRHSPLGFAIASRVHELAVIVLLVALPFSKLAHVLIRPLQLGARVQNRPAAERAACVGCGAPLAPVAQIAAVEALLAQRGAAFAGHQRHCPPCRRRLVASAQARLLGAPFHPDLVAKPTDHATLGGDTPRRKVA